MTIKVDLLPTEKRGFQIDPLVIVLVVFVLATSGAFYYYGQTLEQQIKKLEDERVTVEAKIKECETAKKAIEKERERLAKLEQQFQLVKNLMHDPLKYANIMSEVGGLLPDTVFIDSLNIEPASSSITFSGTAQGVLPLAVISATIKNFNESAYFDGAALQTATRVNKDGIEAFTFGLNINFNATAATEKPPGTKDGGVAAPPPPTPDDTPPGAGAATPGQ